MNTAPGGPGPVARRPMGHLPVLDGLRGAAIALVFCVHLYSPVFSGGSSGVDLFFVLSGFLITKLALEEADRSGGLSRSQFYLRRLFRIFPALMAMLAFLLVASFTYMNDIGGSMRREVLLAAASIGNLWPVFYGFEPREVLGHTWSLGIEEQFYLLWPLILCLVPISFVAPRRFAKWVAAVALASVLIGRLIVVGLLDYPHWKAIPFLDFDGLALGCILALVLHSDDAGRWRRVPQWLIAVAVALVAVDLFGARAYLDRDVYDLRSLVLRGCFFVVLAGMVVAPGVRLGSVLRIAPLQWLGRLSYSLYLWHVPVFAMFSQERNPDSSRPLLVALKVSCAVGASLLSYFLIEQPAIRYGRRLRERHRVAPASAAVPGGDSA